MKDTGEEEAQEAKKIIQTLSSENEKSARKIVELEVKLSQVKCENRVCRKMVVKYDELVNGLRKQVLGCSWLFVRVSRIEAGKASMVECWDCTFA